MTKREAAFALALLVSGASVIYGVAQLSTAVAWIVGGCLFCVGAWLVMSE